MLIWLLYLFDIEVYRYGYVNSKSRLLQLKLEYKACVTKSLVVRKDLYYLCLYFCRFLEECTSVISQVKSSKVTTLCSLMESMLYGRGGPDLEQVEV